MKFEYKNTTPWQSRWSLAWKNIKTAFSYPWEKIKQKNVSIGKKIGFGILGVAELLGTGVTLSVAVGFAIFNKPLASRTVSTTTQASMENQKTTILNNNTVIKDLEESEKSPSTANVRKDSSTTLQNPQFYKTTQTVKDDNDTKRSIDNIQSNIEQEKAKNEQLIKYEDIITKMIQGIFEDQFPEDIVSTLTNPNFYTNLTSKQLCDISLRVKYGKEKFKKEDFRVIVNNIETRANKLATAKNFESIYDSRIVNQFKTVSSNSNIQDAKNMTNIEWDLIRIYDSLITINNYLKLNEK